MPNAIRITANTVFLKEKMTKAEVTVSLQEVTRNLLFRGYYFRTGKSNGRTALVAYPAKYRSSGVTTFVVTRDGVVYEKDFGLN